MRLAKFVATGWTALGLALAAGVVPRAAQADDPWSRVDVEIVSDGGEVFPTYPADSRQNLRRAYLEARNQARYHIRVHNRASRRVGLVIAVDGRNIISGARSDLVRGEPMYILEPDESTSYEGWRTSETGVHEFYFTDWQDSYAEAFGDRSARGVIAVAVFRERVPAQTLRKMAPSPQDEQSRAPQRGASEPAPTAKSEEKARQDSAGTGFGEELYSPVRRVAFEAERSPAVKYIFKYEWRDTLCGMRVIQCVPPGKNRFWDEGERLGFAPFPPGR
jgi:hypothetical protein